MSTAHSNLPHGWYGCCLSRKIVGRLQLHPLLWSGHVRCFIDWVLVGRCFQAEAASHQENGATVLCSPIVHLQRRPIHVRSVLHTRCQLDRSGRKVHVVAVTSSACHWMSALARLPRIPAATSVRRLQQRPAHCFTPLPPCWQGTIAINLDRCILARPCHDRVAVPPVCACV
jgi:hypothetical protein